MKRVKTLFAINVLLLVYLSGCGGGGGHGGEVEQSNSNISGTAAVGAPISNKEVVIRDSVGNTKTVTTNADGSFTIDVAGMTSPWLFKISDPALIGKYLYGYAEKAGTANIHPLTDSIVRAWFWGKGNDIDLDFDNYGTSDTVPIPIGTEIDSAKVIVKEMVLDMLEAASSELATTPDNFDLMTTPFSANHNGFDMVLDGIRVSVTGAVLTVKVISGTELDTAITSTGGVDFATESIIATQPTTEPIAPTPIFSPYTSFPVSSKPEAIAIGDVNSDGRNDVVMTTSFYSDPENDYRLFVFIQNISVGLEAPVKYTTKGTYSNRPQTIAVGDINDDGRNDVVIGNSGLNIEVFFQKVSGELDPGIAYSTANSNKIKIGDLNNDGLLDVAGIGWGTNTADVFLQNVNGTLNGPITYSVTHGGYDDIDIGDVNNDGLMDIVVISGQSLSPNAGVLIQKSDGTFNSAVYYDLGGNELTRGVAISDINGDLLNDIVVSYGGNRPSSMIGVFLQNNQNTLELATSYSSYDCPEPVEIADINNDGRKDIIVAHGGWNALGVYSQNANGSLNTEELYSIPYASHYNPNGLASGDIDSNGSNDVVIADSTNGLVVLYHR